MAELTVYDKLIEIDKRMIDNAHELNSLIKGDSNYGLLWGLIHERIGLAMRKNGLEGMTK